MNTIKQQLDFDSFNAQAHSPITSMKMEPFSPIKTEMFQPKQEPTSPIHHSMTYQPQQQHMQQLQLQQQMNMQSENNNQITIYQRPGRGWRFRHPLHAVSTCGFEIVVGIHTGPLLYTA